MAPFQYPITGSNIPKQECILNFCYDYTGTNTPYLEKPEQLDSFFPDSFHKIKYNRFQNISKCSIHRLIPFKYNNTCDLCDTIQDKDKRGKSW